MRGATWILAAAATASCFAIDSVSDVSSQAQAPAVSISDAPSRFQLTRNWSIGPDAISGGYVHRCHSISDVDGVRELAVQVEIDWNAARVCVLSGASGSVLYTLECPAERHFNCTVGYALRQLDDLDGDGVDDFAVGDPSLHPWDGQMGPYSVLFVSARTGSLLHSVVEREAHGYGISLLASQDLDGDGLGDLLVRSWQGPNSVIDALSSKSGARIWRTRAADSFGYASPLLLLGDDVNGDGIREFIDLTFEACAADAPVAAYSGASGASIGVDAAEMHSWRARAVGPLHANSDIDGDGARDFVRVPYEHGGSVEWTDPSPDAEARASGSAGTTSGELLFVHDFDQDGVADFVFANGRGVAVEMWNAHKR